MWTVALFFVCLAAVPNMDALNFNFRTHVTQSPRTNFTSKASFCYQLCGLKQRRVGIHPWVSRYSICACFDDPSSERHTYETKQCRPPKPQESFWSRGELKTCDISLCNVYLTAFKLLDTASTENAFVCEFQQVSQSRITKFCMCDFKYTSVFDNSVEMDDNTAMEARYKMKIQKLESQQKQ